MSLSLMEEDLMEFKTSKVSFTFFWNVIEIFFSFIYYDLVLNNGTVIDTVI